jgi:hypothetical protein
VAPTPYGAAHGSEHHEDQSDKDKDDPDGPENRDLGNESNQQQDDAENDHSLLLTVVAVCSIDRQPQSTALSASLGPGAYGRERQDPYVPAHDGHLCAVDEIDPQQRRSDEPEEVGGQRRSRERQQEARIDRVANVTVGARDDELDRSKVTPTARRIGM